MPNSLSIHPLTNLGCFHVLSLMSDNAMNVEVQLSP